MKKITVNNINLQMDIYDEHIRRREFKISLLLIYIYSIIEI